MSSPSTRRISAFLKRAWVRRDTAHSGVNQAFVLGVQKCGSTLVSNWMAEHPAIAFSEQKEPNYFIIRGRGDRELKAYLSGYQNKKGATIRAEGSNLYFWGLNQANHLSHHEYARENWNYRIPEDIKKLFGEGVKFIVIFRNPVERAISAYLHHFRAGRLRGTERFADLGGRSGILEFGLYHTHLERWLGVFPRSSFHFMVLDDVVREPQSEWRAVCEFLGVAYRPVDPGRVNSAFRLAWIDGCLSLDSASQKRVGRLEREGQLHAQYAIPSFSEDDLTFLAGYYAESVDKLGKLLRRDLSCWADIESPWPRLA